MCASLPRLDRGPRAHDRGQALVEFAIAFPLQLLIVFGILQLALLYVSGLVVNYAAYRCVRAAIVGEHLVDTGEGRTGVDLVAHTILAPLAGSHSVGGVDTPPPVEIPGWGPVRRSDRAGEKVYVEVLDPDPDDPGVVTAVVEFNQELVFPFVDGLFRLVLRGDEDVGPDAHVFGERDVGYQGPGSGDYIRPGSGRGRIRVFDGVTHFVITRECTLYRGAASYVPEESP